MSNPNWKDNKRGGFYWKDGKPYASVTQILQVIDKPALRNWYAEQVYYAMVANPNQDKKSAMAAPFKKSQDAIQRGRTVHDLVEAYKKGNKVEDVPEPYQGYARAFYTAVDQLEFKILEQERTIFSDDKYYGGTLDLLIKMGKGGVFIADVKTGKYIYDEAFLQTSAYAYVVNKEMPVEGIGVLLLNEKGTYKWQATRDWKKEFEGFKAAQTLWMTLNKDTLEKIKFYEGR